MGAILHQVRWCLKKTCKFENLVLLFLYNFSKMPISVKRLHSKIILLNSEKGTHKRCLLKIFRVHMGLALYSSIVIFSLEHHVILYSNFSKCLRYCFFRNPQMKNIQSDHGYLHSLCLLFVDQVG